MKPIKALKWIAICKYTCHRWESKLQPPYGQSLFTWTTIASLFSLYSKITKSLLISNYIYKANRDITLAALFDPPLFLLWHNLCSKSYIFLLICGCWNRRFFVTLKLHSSCILMTYNMAPIRKSPIKISFMHIFFSFKFFLQRFTGFELPNL